MRLIDADALKKEMVEVEICTRPYSHFCSENVVFGYDINEAPTIDAVPVVRCKECIHAIKFRSGQVICGYHDWCRVQVDPDGYCNHGEKDE